MDNPTRACVSCSADIAHRHGNAQRCQPCSSLAQAVVTAHHRERVDPCVIDDAECVPGRLRRGMCDKHYRRAKGKPQASRERRCVVCSSPFRTNRDGRLTCSNACRQWAQEHPGESDRLRQCPVCDAQIDLRRGSVYCSLRCRSAASKRRHRDITAPYVRRSFCIACGAELHAGRRAGSKYCSEECGDRFYRAPDRFACRFGRTCERCGERLAPAERINRRFCTTSCQVMWNQEKRRARKRGLPCEDISRAEIFERDGMICHLCNGEITEKPTIDHVIPISHLDSPGHVWENVAAAHSSCNISKRDRLTQHDLDLYARLYRQRHGLTLAS